MPRALPRKKWRARARRYSDPLPTRRLTLFLPDVPISVTFGALIAASNFPNARVQKWDADTLQRNVLRQILAYGLLFHCPDSFMAFIWYPDWNLGYFIPWKNVGFAGALALDALLLGLLLAGGLLALRLSRTNRWGATVPVAAGLLVFAGVMAFVWERYNHVGTFAQYHAGSAAAASGDAVFQMFTALAGAYLIVPLATLLGSNLLRARAVGN